MAYHFQVSYQRLAELSNLHLTFRVVLNYNFSSPDPWFRWVLSCSSAVPSNHQIYSEEKKSEILGQLLSASLFSYSICTLYHWLVKCQLNFNICSGLLVMEKEMATHSSVLAWRIPGMREPGGMPSMGSHRVGHDWSDLAAAEEDNYSKTLIYYAKEKLPWINIK